MGSGFLGAKPRNLAPRSNPEFTESPEFAGLRGEAHDPFVDRVLSSFCGWGLPCKSAAKVARCLSDVGLIVAPPQLGP